MADDKDETVLGNLPRARPGRRSDKRAGAKRGGGATQKRQPAAGATASRAGSSARAAATSSRRKTTSKAGARPSSSSRKQPPRPAPSRSRGPDPVGDVFRLAGKLAEVGIKTAGGIIKRLPGR